MAKLNVEKLKAQLVKSIEAVVLAQAQAVNEGMIELRAEYIDRIFQDGEDSDGGKIGSYSTKPIYVSPASLPSQVRKSGMKPRGKGSRKGQRNQRQFKNGKDRKSQYFPGGYAEFRQTVGRQSEKVDLFLTGELRGDIRLGTTEGRTELAFTQDEQLKKAQGNESRFNKSIFAVSEQELEIVTRRWEEEVSDAFFKSFE